MGRFETEILTTRRNLKSLMDLAGMWIDRVRQHRSLDKLILDLDSSVSETYGRQEGSAYNGHFTCNCYHPLFCFNHLGDLDRVLLRNGNAASADHWHAMLKPVVARRRSLWSGITSSCIKLGHGSTSVVSWPKWNGTKTSCSPASASS